MRAEREHRGEQRPVDVEVEAPFEHQAIPRYRPPVGPAAHVARVGHVGRRARGGEPRFVGWRGGCRRRQAAAAAFLLGEVGFDDVLGDRRGQIAVLAVLGEDDAGDLRVVARREEHEPAVVAQVLRCLRGRAVP